MSIKTYFWCWLPPPPPFGGTSPVGGGYIAGPIGMFLGVPTVAVIAYLVNLKTEESLRKQEIESLTNDKDSHKVDKFNVKDMFRKKNTKKEDK